MQKRFTGRTAVITGGASGIGLAIARRFIQEGGKVIANDINAERVAALAAELGEFGVAMVGDVTREDDVASLFSTAINRFGSVDASFHVAGANRHAYIARMEEAD
jgi:3-oxoacyl-[acyl-carrier protein] reductase